MRARTQNPITFRYCNLTEQDATYGNFKLTAEFPRESFNSLVEAVEAWLPGWLESPKCRLSAAEAALFKKVDVATLLMKANQDPENPDVVLVDFKSKPDTDGTRRFGLTDADGGTWDDKERINHGTVGLMEFNINPGVHTGKPYIGRYLNKVMVTENGSSGDVAAF